LYRPAVSTGVCVCVALLLSFAIDSSRAQEQTDPPLDSIEQRAQPCMACHGKEGRATPEGYYPRIAGKPSGYLYNQLQNFRDGHRVFPMMTYMVERQPSAFLRELADYFANVDLPYAQPVASRANSATLARGRELVMDGDESLRIPACKSCHGANLLGVLPAVPGLLGLAPDYVIGQMGAWRNGTRRARAPDCMAQIAQRLQPGDINAVGSWLATQAVPDRDTPVSRFERDPPLPCGSIPPPQSGQR
jgi:cytochrome c553